MELGNGVEGFRKGDEVYGKLDAGRDDTIHMFKLLFTSDYSPFTVFIVELSARRAYDNFVLPGNVIRDFKRLQVFRMGWK